ncbi:hypothetical protein JIN84_01155 [Luteolibacter yonseiensis]|uniref:P pilus assembly chaperone PapD n=1 Tax=Luteolibacter yonseiensis TaxID=1144680 RepID=A0A934R2A6_9BACT|nr:hypothetical protein [Luteolibacter yonseiensis]MBK1814215.1 hypothetical protein [Luteolibacter yonseiensis]
MKNLNEPLKFLHAIAGLLSVLLLCPDAWAATEVRVLDLRDGAASNTIYIRHAGTVTPVKLAKMNLSDSLRIAEPDGKISVADLPEQLRDGRPPSEACQVALDTEWRRVVLIVFPGSTGGGLFRIHAINASPEVFPKGGVHLANLTNFRVIGRLGSRTIQMEPASMGLVQPPNEQVGDYPVMIDCVAKGSQERRPLLRGTWRREPDARQLVFIVPAPGRTVPRVFSIPDFDPAGVPPISNSKQTTDP